MSDVRHRHRETFTVNVFDLSGDRKQTKMASNTRSIMKLITHASLLRKTFAPLP